MDSKLREIGQCSTEIFSLTAQLAECAGPASVQTDLIAAIRELMQSLDRDLKYAETFVEDEEDPNIRQWQTLVIKRHREDYKTHGTLYRKAVLCSKDASSRAQIMPNPDLSTSDLTSTSEESREKTKPEYRTRRDDRASTQVLQASADVTAELRKTHALMSEELSKSALSQELLEESSATLARLGEEYGTFGTLLNGSKRLIKELEMADRIDQLWIWGSFGFFCLVVAFILYRRILSRPVNALLWTGSFMFSHLGRRKVLEHQVVSTDPRSSSRPAVIPAEKAIPSLDKTSLDEAIDLVIPDLNPDESEQSRINRASVNDKGPIDSHFDDQLLAGGSGDDDRIVHAEL